MSNTLSNLPEIRIFINMSAFLQTLRMSSHPAYKGISSQDRHKIVTRKLA
jgi:hypothetical protein